MTFSIITVCFNSIDTVRKTFDSVLEQDWSDYEYVVVDGASTDGTLELIREYEKKFQGKMRFVSEKDHGIYDAMNKGIALAEGEFLLMLNSDDKLFPGALKAAAATMEKHPEADVYYGIEIFFNADGTEEGVLRHPPEKLPFGFSLRHQSTFIRRSLHDSYGNYDGASFPICADYDFFVRLFCSHVHFCPIPAIIAEFHAGGTSSLRLSDTRKEKLQIRRKYGFLTGTGFILRMIKLHLYRFSRFLLSWKGGRL